VSDRLLGVAAIATMHAMNRKPLMGALIVAAASLLATGAYAQNNNASPQGKAAAADKGNEKKADDKAKADDKGKPSVEDRGAKKAKEHEALKERLKAKLKTAPDDAMKQEIRHHAERIAKLERIKAVATTEKDTATADKATTLLTKENDRHDKWMDRHAGGAMPTTATPPATPTPATTPTGGAK